MFVIAAKYPANHAGCSAFRLLTSNILKGTSLFYLKPTDNTYSHYLIQYYTEKHLNSSYHKAFKVDSEFKYNYFKVVMNSFKVSCKQSARNCICFQAFPKCNKEIVSNSTVLLPANLVQVAIDFISNSD